MSLYWAVFGNPPTHLQNIHNYFSRYGTVASISQIVSRPNKRAGRVSWDDSSIAEAVLGQRFRKTKGQIISVSPNSIPRTGERCGEYDVECILNMALHSKTGDVHYLLKWADYPTPTWEHTSKLHCPAIVKQFLEGNSPLAHQFNYGTTPSPPPPPSTMIVEMAIYQGTGAPMAEYQAPMVNTPVWGPPPTGYTPAMAPTTSNHALGPPPIVNNPAMWLSPTVNNQATGSTPMEEGDEEEHWPFYRPSTPLSELHEFFDFEGEGLMRWMHDS